jgi:hypothetical protein
MTHESQRRTRKPLLVNVVWAAAMVFVLGIGYTLSYAPVVGLLDDDPLWVAQDGSELPMYRPVDWLVDNSPPARRLLFCWANLWGVEDDFLFNHRWRRGELQFRQL